MPRPKRIICVEEHFSLPGFTTTGPNQEAVLDLETHRLQAMDEAGVDMQVLSLSAPGVQGERDTIRAVRQAKQANDVLAELVNRHPRRFAGLASLALQDPFTAPDELERAVRQLGLKGALINGHTHGEYLDNEKFWPVWERAEELDVPIYLHPTLPDPPWKVFEGYPVLASSAAGWAYETAGHALRVVCNGVFERFPRAKLVLGHMGEGLPFGLWRLDKRWTFRTNKKALLQPPSFFVRRNIVIATSGVFSRAPLNCAIDAFGPEAIMFAVDYPHESMNEGVTFLSEVDIDDQVRNMIAYQNAERLLKLDISVI